MKGKFSIIILVLTIGLLLAACARNTQTFEIGRYDEAVEMYILNNASNKDIYNISITLCFNYTDHSAKQTYEVETLKAGEEYQIDLKDKITERYLSLSVTEFECN